MAIRGVLESITKFPNFSIPAIPLQSGVMIAPDLLQILVCPACKGPLEYRDGPESLKCTECRRVYPVKDNIPIMLVDEAVVEP